MHVGLSQILHDPPASDAGAYHFMAYFPLKFYLCIINMKFTNYSVIVNRLKMYKNKLVHGNI